MNSPSRRPAARGAGTELVVLQLAEELAAWLLTRTMRWPKHARLSMTSRLESLVLDVVEELVQARYAPAGRLERLDHVNLALERARYLVRLARTTNVCSRAHHEGAMRRLDELGRTLHGWRASVRARKKLA
ncbi:MAG: four helix bundle protein [Planctomycetota bacterium]